MSGMVPQITNNSNVCSTSQMAPSHWLLITMTSHKVLQHSHENDYSTSSQATIVYSVQWVLNCIFKITAASPRDQWVKSTRTSAGTVMNNSTILTWWRHQMETLSALLAFCAGNSPVTGEFPSQRPVTCGFDVFFDLRLNKQLSKQSWSWWFETPSYSLWRQCNVTYLRTRTHPSHNRGHVCQTHVT